MNYTIVEFDKKTEFLVAEYEIPELIESDVINIFSKSINFEEFNFRFPPGIASIPISSKNLTEIENKIGRKIHTGEGDLFLE